MILLDMQQTNNSIKKHAKKFIGKPLLDSNGEKIGEIVDIVMEGNN